MQQHRGNADVNGTSLYCEVAGAGGSLVLMHGQGLAACGKIGIDSVRRLP